MNFSHKLSLIVLLAIISFSSLYAQNITINADGNLNDHADQIGIWLNSNADSYSTEYVNILKDLKIQSIRHGWAYSVIDKNDPNKFVSSPCDPGVQAYIRDANCNLIEPLPLSDVARVTEELDVPGFAVLGTDGINYTGTSDSQLAAMTRIQREEFYLDNAERWAIWARNNNFQYFELGNENDLPGEMVDSGVGIGWTSSNYGAFAKRMAQRIKSVYPEAKCGINGGWGATPALRNQWWDGILQGAPDINNYIDFVVIHKYEFGVFYNNWQPNLYDWGRIQNDNYTSINRNFPGKPVYVTEMSGIQVESAIVPHYRGVLTVEMMGNALIDNDLELIQHWGTRWRGNLDLVLDDNSNQLNMIGNSLKAYTQFMKKRLVSNGTSGNIRFFAAKNPSDNSMTVWLINHSESNETTNISINNFEASPKGDVWRLTSANNNPFAENNTLSQDGTVESINGSFSITASPTSVTIITFAANDLTPSLTDLIISIDGPDTVTPNNTFTTTIKYSASTNRDIRVALQLNRAPWTTFGDTRINVSKGEATIPVNINVNGSIPLMENDYKWIAYITTRGGNWSSRFDFSQKEQISAISSIPPIISEIAQGKNASQKSTLDGHSASKAVDGNTDGKFSNGSVTHTACGTKDWWRVDLGDNYNIQDIKIWNRTDACCSARLSDYDVKILDENKIQVWSNYQPDEAEVPTSINAANNTGRYVEIQLRGSGCLSIAEVKVYGSSSLENRIKNQSTLSVKDKGLNKISIFPNPFSEYAIFKLADKPKEFTLKIRSLNGNVLIKKNYKNTQEFRVNGGDLSPGLYLYEITFLNNTSIRGKIITQ
ncbi:discoidin domain-containing protein [uncultured Aquimarina sp.]|uniref:galactose-binding domain-containing protein n=1 Tax=uncultured Aquimarina sp. TaxID=575652 RepID=UPI00262B0DAC|nr:discoidin domain-containing protein [uncultured Aquimarina sp.]